MEQIKRLIADAGETFGRLSSREKLMVLGAAFSLVAFLLFFISFSFNNAMRQADARVAGKLRQLQEVQRLASGYSQADKERAALDRKLRGNKVKLFTLVEETAKQQGIEVGGMTERGNQTREGKIIESSVDVTFTRIELVKLVRFLSAIEGRDSLVKVTKLQMRSRKDQPVLDAWLTLTTYQLES
ncbi:MAG: type II secretion system protein M [Myxococcaceae bacterium]|nr:type II secretion system protein M [Myxococcaceae bacterium]